MKTEVILVREELWWAKQFGEARLRKRVAKKTKPGEGLSEEDNTGAYGLKIEIDGVEYEMALAKALNKYWTGITHRWIDGDVGEIEARGTDWKFGCLLLHKKDIDDRAYVLVIKDGEGGYTLTGWIHARDGKKEEWWEDKKKNDRPCYYVPQHALHRMEDLPVR